jgi:tetratricopeptide (TPR) repeat protein
MKEKLPFFLKNMGCVWILILTLSACGLKDVAYYHNLGVQAETQGKMDEAKSAYLEALKLDPEHAPSFYNLGNTYYVAKNWKDAKENYIRGLIEDTNNAPAWCNLGQTYIQLKEREKAYTCFTNAWDIDPSMTQALISHASALVEEGKEGEAIRILEKGKKSEDGRVLFNLGMLQYERAEYKDALANFERAAELNKDELRMHIMICRALIKLDRNTEAMRALAKVRELDTMGWQEDLLQAELNLKNNRLREAEEALHKHLDLFPDSYDGLLISGEVAAKRGEYELAYKRFARAAAVDYTRKEAALREVDMLFALKRSEDARDRLSVLVLSFPEDARVLDGLMRIYFQQGYYDKASVHGEKRLSASGTPKELGEAEVIVGLSHLMNEDISKRNPERGIALLWPHRTDEPKNRLLLRYLYGALVEQKDETRAAQVRSLL